MSKADGGRFGAYFDARMEVGETNRSLVSLTGRQSGRVVCQSWSFPHSAEALQELRRILVDQIHRKAGEESFHVATPREMEALADKEAVANFRALSLCAYVEIVDTEPSAISFSPFFQEIAQGLRALGERLGAPSLCFESDAGPNERTWGEFALAWAAKMESLELAKGLGSTTADGAAKKARL